MRGIVKNIIFIFFCLSVASEAVAQQPLGFAILGQQKKVKIPFELYNNLIVIPVVLNNQLPLKFILDTGVRTTILTERAFSDILNLNYSKKYSIAGIGGENLIEAYITNGVSLTLPGVKGKGHAMLVLEKDYMELRNYMGTDVHGVLGYEIFSRFIVKIDYASKILTITTPRYFKPKRSFDVLDMVVEDTKPYVSAKIGYGGKDEVDVKLMIDSGASGGLILDEDSDHQITVPENNIKSSLGRGLGGLLEGRISRVNQFKLGKNKWDDVIATFPEGNTLLDSLKKTNVFRNGSIGGEILSRFKVIFDFPSSKLYLKKNRQFKRRFKYDLSGLVVKAKGSGLNTFEISEVRENSSGDIAGFKKGDIILSINNVSTENLVLSNVIGLLNAKENKKLKIIVRRDNVRFSNTFRLKSQI